MKIKALAEINYLNLPEKKEISIDWLRISGERQIIENHFRSDEFLMKAIGEVSMRAILSNPVFLYGFGLDTEATTSEDVVTLLNSTLHNLQNLFVCFWFVKDCACTINNLMFKTENIEDCFMGTIQIQNYSADCNNEIVDFTLAEIYEVQMIDKKLKEITKVVSKTQIENYSSSANSQLIKSPSNKIPYSSYSKIDRAFAFLKNARRTDFFAMKIGMYIPLLESLFSDSPNEITHTVSFRTASYLNGCKDEKQEIYDCIKKAYDVRSKYLHGSATSKLYENMEEQIKICKNLDNVIRRVMRNVVLIDSEMFLDKKLLSEKFNSFFMFQ